MIAHPGGCVYDSGRALKHVLPGANLRWTGAAAPSAGYCDYRLWSKPGGHTFPLQPWEEPSWQSRSAVFLTRNFRHTPVWILHGKWDRAVGGEVPVEHSRQMASLLRQHGFSVRYTEVDAAGHFFGGPELLEEVAAWLLQQVKASNPPSVTLETFSLRGHE